MHKKIALGAGLAIAVAFVVSEYPLLVKAVHEGKLGSTSSSSFTVSLTIHPSVRSAEPVKGESSDDICFDAPGFDSLTVDAGLCSGGSLVIKPQNNRFCVSQSEWNELIARTVAESEACSVDIMMVAAD